MENAWDTAEKFPSTVRKKQTRSTEEAGLSPVQCSGADLHDDRCNTLHEKKPEDAGGGRPEHCGQTQSLAET